MVTANSIFHSHIAVGRSTVSTTICETCEAMWDSLSEQYCRPLQNKEHWKQIAKDFEEIWNLPQCVGAIDREHIVFKSPINSGSLYFNYRGFFSTVLMAICDARYVFTLVDIDRFGASNDSRVFCNSTMGKGFSENCMNRPDSAVISNDCSRKNCSKTAPYYLVGDEASHYNRGFYGLTLGKTFLKKM